MNKYNSSYFYMIGIVITSLSQGFLGPIVKYMQMEALSLVVGRCVVAFIILFLISKRFGYGVGVNDRLGVILGGILLSVHWVTLIMAYLETNVSVVLLVLFTYPVITSLLEPLFSGTRIRKTQLFSAFLVFIGVFCLTPNADKIAGIYVGASLALSSAFAFSLRNILNRKLIKDSNGISIMCWQTGVSAIILLPACLYFDTNQYSLGSGLGVLIVGLFFTAIPHTLRVVVLSRLKAATVDILASLQVVSGVIIAWWLLDEEVTVNILLGIALVISAVFIETSNYVRNKTKENILRLQS